MKTSATAASVRLGVAASTEHPSGLLDMPPPIWSDGFSQMTKSNTPTETDTEGRCDGDGERMDGALHPDLAKRWPGEEHGATLGITT
jgi:hypothetical protein